MSRRSFRSLFAALSVLLAASVLPGLAAACACGCGVFDVQTGSVLPTRAGGTAFLEYDFMDQDRNWSGARQAPARDNADLRLKTSLYTLGGRYMLDRRWGVMAEVPYWRRSFTTAGDAAPGVPASVFEHGSLGDVRLRGVYSGFSPDMSEGLTFGVKLPTGRIRQNGLDRDTQIGTGSTDLLLGGYKLGLVGAGALWGWYANALYDQPVLVSGGYRPGPELDAAAGAYFNGATPAGVKVAPLAQLVASQRWSDQGPQADAPDSGYRRLLAGPGLQLVYGQVGLYGEAGFPVWQSVKGDQLVAPVYLKTVLSYAF